MCYSPVLRQDRVTGPRWGRDGKAKGKIYWKKEEERKSEVYLGEGEDGLNWE